MLTHMHIENCFPNFHELTLFPAEEFCEIKNDKNDR